MTFCLLFSFMIRRL